MEWIKLTPENEPDNEVLCANFEPKTYGYMEKIIGYISYKDDEKTYAEAESDHEVLENVTHFIDINKFDIT